MTTAAVLDPTLLDPSLAILSDYTPLATSLFNNMKLPAAVVTAGMISLGFATGFPELPQDTPERQFPTRVRARCETLRRVHIVVALVSVTSELIAVLWAAVEVNQLTERTFDPTDSVWGLIQRDCDLAWSAVNSHFVMGIIGFVAMLALRAYVMLLAARASMALQTAASTGTMAALCLMMSIVNRGVESGGGNGIRYGSTILDLLRHYAVLLFEASINGESPGPLQLSAIVLELTSIFFVLQIIWLGNDKQEEEEEPLECPLVYDLQFTSEQPLTEKEQDQLEICRGIDERAQNGDSQEQEEEAETDTSVNVSL